MVKIEENSKNVAAWLKKPVPHIVLSLKKETSYILFVILLQYLIFIFVGFCELSESHLYWCCTFWIYLNVARVDTSFRQYTRQSHRRKLKILFNRPHSKLCMGVLQGQFNKVPICSLHAEDQEKIKFWTLPVAKRTVLVYAHPALHL